MFNRLTEGKELEVVDWVERESNQLYFAKNLDNKYWSTFKASYESTANIVCVFLFHLLFKTNQVDTNTTII